MKTTLDVLISSNLIEKDPSTGLIKVCPFIDYFVEMKINTQSKTSLLEVLSKYYDMKLTQFKKEYLSKLKAIEKEENHG